MHQVVRKNWNANAHHSSQCLSRPTGRTGHSAGYPAPDPNTLDSVWPLCLAFASSLAQSKDKTQSLSILTTQHTQALLALLRKSSSSPKEWRAQVICAATPTHSRAQGDRIQGLLCWPTAERAVSDQAFCFAWGANMGWALQQPRDPAHVHGMIKAGEDLQDHQVPPLTQPSLFLSLFLKMLQQHKPHSSCTLSLGRQQEAALHCVLTLSSFRKVPAPF